MKRSTPAVALVLLLVSSGVRAEDWPQFRGPNRDGAWKETGVLETFPVGGLKYRWRVPVGPGHSTPVVAGGRVYLTDSQFVAPRSDERVLCFDEATGRTLWTFVYQVDYPDVTQRGMPVATPIVRDGKVYTVGSKGDVICFDAASGKVNWRRNFDADFRVPGSSDFAFNGSPLIEGDLLILSFGSYPRPEDSWVVALDRKTGSLVWKTPQDGVTSSSPIVIDSGGRRQLIVWALKSILSLDPRTGSLNWKVDNRIGTVHAASTPVLAGDLLLIGGVMLKLQPDAAGAVVLWPEGKDMRRRILSNTSTGLVSGEYVYSVVFAGSLVCLDSRTGKQVWANETVTDLRSGSSIHLTPNGNRTFLFTDEGNLIIARLSPDGYEEIARTRLIEPTTRYDGRNRAWTPPAFANRQIFARSDRELVCASLAAEP